MKKLMLIVMVSLGSILVGCDAPPSSENVRNVCDNKRNNNNNAWTSHGGCMTTKIIEIEGHKYIIMNGFECGTIIHAESCSCRK